MNFEKVIRTTLMLSFFLLLFAIRPGFGKIDLERNDWKANGEMTRLTEGKIKVFKEYNFGFRFQCTRPLSVKEANLNGEEFIGLVSTSFIE